MNFPNGELNENDFVYDWSNSPRDFARLLASVFDARNLTASGRLWLTGPAMFLNRFMLENQARFLPRHMGFGPDAGMASTNAVEDVSTAFQGLGDTTKVTRMRANMPAHMLDRDLELAAGDRSERS